MYVTRLHPSTSLRWLFLCFALLTAGCGKPVVPDGKAADTIFFGGPIVTMAPTNEIAEAVAVRAGQIVGVGSEMTIRAEFEGGDTHLRDLAGATLLPGFIDAHGHFLQNGFLAQSAIILPPPDAGVDSFATMAEELRAHADSTQARALGWVIGMGYDDAQLEEQRHPTAADLDTMIADVPVMVIHQSGHLASVNTRGLEALGLTAESTDPPGGVIGRIDGGTEPNGVLKETAYFAAALGVFGRLFADADAVASMIESSQAAYFASGFTVAQEGRADGGTVLGLQQAASAGELAIDVVGYTDPTLYPDHEQFLDVMSRESHEYQDHFRLGGIKLSLDGSPQGKTAWLTEPYHVPPEGAGPDERGFGQVENETLRRLLAEAFDNEWQVLAHVNGDAAIDQFLDAVEAVNDRLGATGTEDRRTVAIHAQTARHDQLDRMAELGIIPSFMSVHTFYWGDWHRDSVLGPDRAAGISPARSALERGLLYTNHNDAPVTLPNAQMILSSQVGRLTRSGQVLGEGERVTPLDALRSITVHAARQMFEEERRGTIEVGKVADFVVLDRDPRALSALELRGLKVLETIKDGVTRFPIETAGIAR